MGDSEDTVGTKGSVVPWERRALQKLVLSTNHRFTKSNVLRWQRKHSTLRDLVRRRGEPVIGKLRQLQS